MIIRNSSEIGSTPLRRHAVEILEAGIEADLPYKVMPKALLYNTENQTLSVNGSS